MHTFSRSVAIALIVLCAASVLCRDARAKVVVLANRSVSGITVTLTRSGQPPGNLTIHSGDSQPVFFDGTLRVSYGFGFNQQEHELKPYTAYFFTGSMENNSLHLEEIGLGKPVDLEAVDALEKSRPRRAKSVTVSVKILVDESEPTHRKIWEPKLRNRVAEASKIIERHTGIRFEVVAVETWTPLLKNNNFAATLREFERLVKPAPAQVAIGFSSEFNVSRGRSHLGVTRWPLHSHILLRERSRDLLEGEKIELLVHELGHYLGASHSPEPQSVMRPTLTRGLQRGVGSRVQFDPVNALIIGIMGEELRRYNIRNVRQITKPTAKQMQRIYELLLKAMPLDTAAQQYLRVLDFASMRLPPKNKTRKQIAKEQAVSPIVRETRLVLDGLMRVANELHERREADPEDAEATGDMLTNRYVRSAAQSALDLRTPNARRAMLLALGIFVDDTNALRKLPATGKFIELVETDTQRERRLQVLGKPTMAERADLTKHFLVSAHLAIALGKQPTAAAGLAKEMIDAQGGTGFSFVDMAANEAGIAFAESVLADKPPLAEIADQFHVDDFLPTLRGLEEGFTADDLQKQFGVDGKLTIEETLEEVKDRVRSLPVYDR